MDGLAARRHYAYRRQVKGHSETSTLSSQPSIDEVRQQMHLLLEEAFSLASAGHTSSSRRQHYQQQHQAVSPYSPGPSIPYSEGPTSAPDTMSHTQGRLQWVPAYSQDLYQCSLSKPVSFKDLQGLSLKPIYFTASSGAPQALNTCSDPYVHIMSQTKPFSIHYGQSPF